MQSAAFVSSRQKGTAAVGVGAFFEKEMVRELVHTVVYACIREQLGHYLTTDQRVILCVSVYSCT